MQDPILSLCVLMLAFGVTAQPIALVLGIAYASWKEKRPIFGPYRDTRDAQLHSAQAEILRLKQALVIAGREKAQQDAIIKTLFETIHGSKEPERKPPSHTISRSRVVGFMSIAAASGVFLGALTAAPTHTSHDHYASRPRPTMQMTWGGEVIMHDVEAWNWRCHNRQPTLLALGSTITTVHCHIPFPELLDENTLSDGDRSWILWYYPERTGPATMTYVLN